MAGRVCALGSSPVELSIQLITALVRAVSSCSVTRNEKVLGVSSISIALGSPSQGRPGSSAAASAGSPSALVTLMKLEWKFPRGGELMMGGTLEWVSAAAGLVWPGPPL